jgi:hypothetical protein
VRCAPWVLVEQSLIASWQVGDLVIVGVFVVAVSRFIDRSLVASLGVCIHQGCRVYMSSWMIKATVQSSDPKLSVDG